uniref:putative baseplate assembly protein n=1 Tax=uncultured Sphingomonas sp. TaxID=158754 RepID=UPI0035CBCB26
MPLASNFPVLDDRNFDDIVAEAKTRIPRYTPEWTDYNPGDPGFALVDLFAWMTEMLVFRLNEVPKLSYLKFLELIGIELRPAQSATTMIVFPVQPTFSSATVAVPRRSQIATAEPDENGRPIVFETERGLTAFRAVLGTVQAYDGYGYTLLTGANTDLVQSFAPFGPLATTGSALMLGFEDGGDFPADAELSLAFWPRTPLVEPPPEPCTGTASPIASPAAVAWEFWAGTEWRPLNVSLDETLALTRSGLVLLRTPPKGQLVRGKLGAATDKARYWLRARLARSNYQDPPILLGVRANAARATEAQTATDEILGGSDGSPDQVFRTANTPILPNSLEVQVYETDAWETWTPVEDFFGLAPDAPAYVPNWATGEARFPGLNAPDSGKGGRIPAANIDRAQTNIVARSYRFGGGDRGNVAAGMISAPMTPIAGIDASGVINPVAAAGGSDEEDIATAMERAPRVLKARDRAVTAGDYELLAMAAGTIARAKAMPLVNPDFPGIQVPGTISVVVIPAIAGTRDQQILVSAPRPVESLLRTICAALDARRMMTTELYVVGPVYVPVSLDIAAILTDDADSSETGALLTAALRTFLHPLYGGADGKGWPFGGTIRYGDLYRAALVSGVDRLDSITVTRNGQPFGTCADVPIDANALVELTDLTIALNTEADAAAEAA